jgi:uncharacterized protein
LSLPTVTAGQGRGGPVIGTDAGAGRSAGAAAIEIRRDPHKGRGVFACRAIEAGELIEAAPVIVLDAEEARRLDRTILYQYYFHWDGDPDGDGRSAVAFGTVSLCNHSSSPRARVERNCAEQTLDLHAVQPIAPGEEVTIDYGCPLWFEVRE